MIEWGAPTKKRSAPTPLTINNEMSVPEVTSNDCFNTYNHLETPTVPDFPQDEWLELRDLLPSPRPSDSVSHTASRKRKSKKLELDKTNTPLLSPIPILPQDIAIHDFLTRYAYKYEGRTLIHLLRVLNSNDEARIYNALPEHLKDIWVQEMQAICAATLAVQSLP